MITEHLEKIVQGRFISKNWMGEEQEVRLRQLAIETFGAIMKSLVEWISRPTSETKNNNVDKDTSIEPQTNGNKNESATPTT